MSRSRHSRTGMSGVVVFGLRSVGFAIQGDITRVEKHQHRRRRVRVTEEYYETALVPDLLPEKAVVQGVPPSGAVGVGDGLKRLVREDRKSTRLNSSHGYISYAVFCLKKKKKKKKMISHKD